MNVSTNIFHAKNVSESEKLVDGGSVKKLCKRLYIILCRCLQFFPPLCRIVRIAKGRKKLIHDSTKIIKHLDNIDLQDKGRKVYLLSTNPDRQVPEHQFFSQNIKNCQLVGKGLVPCINGYLLEESVIVGNNNDTRLATAETRPYGKQVRRLEGKYASLCSHWSYWKGYYHWLLDILPMTALMDEDRKILVNSPLSSYERESLAMLGLLDRCLEVKEDHVIVEDFQFITIPSSTGVYNPFSVEYIHDNIVKSLENFNQLESYKYDKVYLSRVGERRSAQNERELIELLKNKGWTIIEAAKLNFSQQVNLIYHAEIVMGVHGANLANILWGKKGVLKVVELIPANRPVPSNENIALCLEFDYTAIICKSFADGSIEIDIDLVKEVLTKC